MRRQGLSLACLVLAAGLTHAAAQTSAAAVAALQAQAQAAYNQGDDVGAIRDFQRALQLAAANAATPPATRVSLLGGLGRVYLALRQFTQAETVLLQALQLGDQLLPANDPHLIPVLQDLMELSRDQGRAAAGDAYEIRWRQALASSRPAPAPVVISPKRKPGAVATEAHLQHQRLLAEATGGAPLAEQLRAIAQLQVENKNYGVALAYDRQALDADQGAAVADLQGEYWDYTGIADALEFEFLGSFDPATGKADMRLNQQSQAAAQQAAKLQQMGAQRLIARGSEQQELATASALSFDADFDLALDPRAGAGARAGAYTSLLLRQNAVAEHETAAQALVVGRGSRAQRALLAQISAARTQAARWAAQLRSHDQTIKLTQAEALAGDLEAQLVRSLGPGGWPATLPDWHTIQANLRPSDAVVDYVRFRRQNGQREYAAFVITPATQSAPELVDLGNAAELEAGPLAAYRALIRSPAEGGPTLASACAPPPEPVARAAPNPSASYRAFWQPLLPALGTARRIFVTTDGELDEVALGLWPDPAGHMLMQDYDLRVINSSLDLVHPATLPTNQNAVLFANPYFDIPPADYRQALVKLGHPVRETTVVVSSPAAMPPAGTLTYCGPLASVRGLELGVNNSIVPLLTQHGFHATVFAESDATIEAVESIHGPRILHFATHGDFTPDPTPALGGADDPRLRSRLFFAGANETLAGNPPPPPLGDGILTAYQVSQLDLHGTQLVVLSACETGLGDIQDGEGVLGLRRAFEEAGAQAVLMTLWEVPLEQTNDLVERFYKHWLGGEEMHAALLHAQMEVRATSPEPYYWGAFVLVGR